VAFYRGEVAERAQLRQRFDPIISNYKHYVNRTIGFTGWNLSMSQIIVPLPWLLQAGRLFSGEIKFGDVTQSASAFGSIQSGLSFFRNAYDSFAGFRASIIRLHGLVVANEEGRALPELNVEPSASCLLELDAVEVRTPAGESLIEDLNLQLHAGDTLIVTGRSGTGKTTLLRSLGQLWPYTTGTLRCPEGINETMFLSQMPYVPLGDLRTVVAYPKGPDQICDEDLRAALDKVSLPQCARLLAEEADWAKRLSPGEQQRIAFARVLLTRPKVVFLDEATSALDEGLEYSMYALVRRELPDTILVSVTHRSTVGQHHEQHLHLLGGGRWELGEVQDDTDEKGGTDPALSEV
jgi:putative ATP-binding cassette transporter